MDQTGTKGGKEVKINSAELFLNLMSVSMAVSSKELIEQSSCFIFKNGFVYAFNGELAAKAKAPEGITGAVKAQELIAILTKYKKSELDFKCTKTEIVISSGKSKAGLVLNPKIVLPLIEAEAKQGWKDLPKDFAQHLKFVSFAASKDYSEPQLSCVHLTKEGIEASDRYRIVQVKTPLSVEKSILIPIESASAIIKHEPIKYSLETEWIYFINEDKTQLFVRLAHGEFPNIKAILEMEGTELTLPDELESALNKASVFAKDDTSFTVTITNKEMKIYGKNEVGWFEEKMPIKWGGDEFSFGISPKFLMELACRKDKVYIGDTLVKFTGNGLTHCCSIERK